MKRTQIYLEAEQHDFLENMAFVIGKKNRKKVSISELIVNTGHVLTHPPTKN